ncbi:MAG: ATPase, T2SS/T4P/T4SS family [Planctomycetota bacterium]|nr:ATPase, T2SS/T4P/T4SS family [Planctomycetota bacterium]MDA0918788.1 ATPase, T2SS/T4P/T4SS family [Planctomycetota bacterium]MDA1160413.1 ATPase, T2SS/T4P/T4SS family [Planctomycetota bacterium]
MEISEVLIRHGLLTTDQGDQVRKQANGHRFDKAVIEMGLLTEEQTLRAFADELGMKYVELKNFTIDPELLNLFPTSTIYRHSLLPLRRDNGRVEVATSDPFDLEALDELSSLSNLRLEPVLARHSDVVQFIKEKLGVGGDTINELVKQKTDDDDDYLAEASRADGELAEMAQQASVIRLVNELLLEALQQQASDVHIEPGERGLRIRYRVDGMLRVQSVPPEINQFFAAIVTRLKIMSRLNIAEKRLPQDGRIELRVAGRDIDVRVSIIPMLHGEGIVLRILDKGRMVFNLSSMGMPDPIYKPFQKLISLPHGIVLVTGPTGSGKSTTLYSALNEIRSPNTKVITVEDPVEYQLDGISQIQVHSRIGLTFAAGLRSILRHDPDVILIGEIRDYETAEAAIQASLTGHLVFSTLHTNDAASSFTRLVDMGVEPYLVASTVEGVMAQRLVRRLCVHCRESFQPSPEELPKDFPNRDIKELFRAVGCRECGDTGYSGRIGAYELLLSDDTVREMCGERVSSTKIRQYGVEHGMVTLRQCGWLHAMNGTTSIEDVIRITKGDIV